MIRHPAFRADPWAIRETALDLDALPQTESIFALSNGHIGLRANLDEGEPFGLPGTYLAGCYEARPLPYAEAGYGYPESGQSVVNVTNGKIVRLLVGDEPFDVRYGTLEEHERRLDLRGGLLHRRAVWRSPTGQVVRLRTTRLVSFSHRSVAAVHYEVEPLEEDVPVVVQSELVANEVLPDLGGDPRVAALLAAPLEAELSDRYGAGALLVHRTRASRMRIGAAMEHLVDGPEGTEWHVEVADDLARVTVTADVGPGRPLRLVKFLAYGWSGSRSLPAIRDQVEAALAGARHRGWDALVRDQRAYLDNFWSRADVEIEGEPALQQAVRFALYHTLQAGARGEERALAAKGLTGPGYDGHAFWDTETFVLPVLTYTAPRAARDALGWRHRTMGLARERAHQLGLEGAAFPWRTIAGQECSGYWPAGVAAFHVNADIADAVVRYQDASDDQAFATAVGLPLLVETARLWRSLGHFDGEGWFRIDGVTGPDEYSAVADNNVYTNLMAQRNLQAAADGVDAHPEEAAGLHAGKEEVASWREAADRMFVPYDTARGVHPQSEGFTEHQRWDFDATAPLAYPLLLHAPYFDLYRKQVVKQADLVLALHLRGDAFTPEEKARDFAYYEAITVRDSSLSACTQAVMAAEIGHLDLAHAYLCEAALMDLDDLEHNTRDGLHIAALAGTWIALVAGMGGMRDHHAGLCFSPRLPSQLSRLTFRIVYRGRVLRVDVTHDTTTYDLLRGEAVDLHHHGHAATVDPSAPLTLANPPAPRRDPPSQPPGRAPAGWPPDSDGDGDACGSDPAGAEAAAEAAAEAGAERA